MSVAFLIIDAQYDFCDPDGALFVPGAKEDMDRIASLIKTISTHIDQIFLTLDTHHVLDISHPGFWQNMEGKNPEPFTSVSLSDVQSSKWLPRYNKQEVINYLKNLESGGEFGHFIWPEHCLTGTKGASFIDTISQTVRDWSVDNQKNYITITKGTHPLTEHFGVFQAQVPIAEAPETHLNVGLLEQLESFDLILIAGEARSHCVATSLKQLLKHKPALAPKIIMIADGMSDVTGLGHLAHPIFESSIKMGVNFKTCKEVSNLLQTDIKINL